MTDATITTIIPAPFSSADDEAVFAAFVGPNANIYRHTLEKMNFEGGKGRKFPMTWCWPALLVPLPWLLYRKLYIWAAAILVIPILFGLIFPKAGGAGLGIMALIGKPIYVEYALKKIAKFRAQSKDEKELLTLAERAGGVSIPGAIVGSVIMLGFFILAFLAATGQSH